ncbi:hypothetical protein ACAG26_08235 [Mycobacterium sp. pUA109]|uniref:hypothetical protein n=1 Tax=Mycobacterium sp. pUA109 TaxID=3238982 RepID=UPI00351B9E0A
MPPVDLDGERTAVGRVLFANRGAAAIPPALGRPRWDRRDRLAIVIDDHDGAGLSWVAAPVWRPDGRCAAAVAALVDAPTVSPGLKDLVTCAARRIGQQLQLAIPGAGRPGPYRSETHATPLAMAAAWPQPSPSPKVFTG